MRKAIFKERGIKLGLIGAVFVPSLVLMMLQAASMATGLLIVAILILLVTIIVISIQPQLFFISRSVLLWMMIVFGLILFHYSFSRILVSLPQNDVRFITSLAGLILIFSATFIIAASIVKLHHYAVQRIISAILFILVVNAILSLTGIDYFGVASRKPTLLFSEPSHLAFVTAPFLIYYVKSRSQGWLFALMVFSLYAIYIENLTMLVTVILTIVVGFEVKKFIIFSPIIVVSLLTIADIDYFSSRVMISSVESSNTSGLVFFQGWQNAFIALKETMGWGVGFQQFGIASSTGEITERINVLLHGYEPNLLDGGTTATKLIGEFGLLGASLVVVLIVRATHALWVLKRGDSQPKLLLFARCVDIGIVIELLIRGVGYFSPGIFIYLIMYFCRQFNELEKYK